MGEAVFWGFVGGAALRPHRPSSARRAGRPRGSSGCGERSPRSLPSPPGWATSRSTGPAATCSGGIQAFAAGAILVMLVDTMIPEAFVAVGERHGRPADTRFERRLQRNQWLGLVTTLGFALAYLLSTLE
jgi:hypothetical protein